MWFLVWSGVGVGVVDRIAMQAAVVGCAIDARWR